MPLTAEEIAIQDEFMKAVSEISYYQPELDLEIAQRIENDTAFFWATTHRGEDLLQLALERRKNRMSTNIYIFGGGSIQVGKSVGALIIAFVEDPDFDIAEQLMFDFTELDQKLPRTKRGKRYILDDVRNRLTGTGAIAEKEKVVGFMETNGANAISLTLASPKYHELTAIQYTIELIGFCDKFSLGILYNRKMTPIAYLKFETGVIPNFEKVYKMYQAEKDKFMLRMKKGGAGVGYLSGKVEQIHAHILEEGLEFEDKAELKDFIVLNYDHFPQRVQDASYRQLVRILGLKDQAVDVAKCEVQEGQSFRDFLAQNLKGGTVKAVIARYHKDDLPTMTAVGSELGIGNHSQVNAILKPFREKLMGDLFEIWIKQGDEPSKEGEVDTWEDGTPTNLKCTYRRYDFCRVDADKMQPEIKQAIEKGTKVRIRVFSLWHNAMFVKDFDPKAVLKRGVAQVDYK